MIQGINKIDNLKKIKITIDFLFLNKDKFFI